MEYLVRMAHDRAEPGRIANVARFHVDTAALIPGEPFEGGVHAYAGEIVIDDHLAAVWLAGDRRDSIR